MTNMIKLISFRWVVYAVAGTVISMLAGSMLFNSILLYRLSNVEHQDSLRRFVQHDSLMIAEHLKSYNTLVEYLAQRPQTRHLLHQKKPEITHSWLKSVSNAHPILLNIALFLPNGILLNTAGNLNLSKHAKAYAQTFLEDQASIGPPVYEINRQNGYLLIARRVVSLDGDALGIILLSLSTEEIINNVHNLKSLRGFAEGVRLYDGARHNIAGWGVNKAFPFKLIKHEESVPNSDWSLQIYKLTPNFYSVYQLLLLSILAGALLTTVIIVVSKRILTKDFLYDFEVVKKMVAHIAEARPVDEMSINPRLASTADIIADILPDAEKIQHNHSRLTALSCTDELTQLPNRRAFKTMLEQGFQQVSKDKSICLLLLDLDGFKQLNDQAGHPVGDTLLQLLADVLQRHIYRGDSCARIGGDEFTALLSDVTETQVAQRLQQINAYFYQAQENNQDFKGCPRCTISFGFSFIRLEKDNMELLLKRADYALYAAKSAGKNTYRSA